MEGEEYGKSIPCLDSFGFPSVEPYVIYYRTRASGFPHLSVPITNRNISSELDRFRIMFLDGANIPSLS